MNLNQYIYQNHLQLMEGHVQQCQAESDILRDLINGENIKEVMEIGFNGGHSADLFLSTNNNINLTSFDLGEYSYINKCKEYISNKYPNRHTLIIGNSLNTVPEFLSKSDKKFDLIFIDGGHTYEIAKQDILNCKKLAHKDTIVIVDDTMNTPEWVKHYNVGPTKAWKEAVGWGIIKELGSKDCAPTHGLSWGKYLF